MRPLARLVRSLAAGVRGASSLHPAARVDKEPGLERVPAAKGLPLFGTTPAFVAAGSAARLHKYIDARHAELGPIFRERIGQVDAVFVSDPEMTRGILTRQEGKYPLHVKPEAWIEYHKRRGPLRGGLFFMDGEEWLRSRRAMNRILLAPEPDGRWIEAPVRLVAEDLVARWRRRSAVTPDLEPELYRASIEVILGVMMGSQYSSRARAKYDDLLARFSDRVRKIFLYTAKMYVLPARLYADLNLPAWRGFVAAVEDSVRMGHELVESVYESHNRGGGLVERMIAQDLDKETIIKILIDFVIAAGDTTSFTIQWALYQLAMNRDIVDEYRSSDREARERLMRCITKETMRLYPVAPFLTRILPADSYVGGYKLPSGTLVVMSTYTSSRDSSNFTNPLKFAPKRWDKRATLGLEAEDRAICPYASLPFAIGSRSCIGRKIATIQMNEIISKIITNFDMELLNEQLVQDEMQMVLKPKERIRISFKTVDVQY